MKLLILGATGPTGRHALDAALAAGDDVTVLVRRPDALDEYAARVRVVVGDATVADDVAHAASGQDAVISALGRAKSVRAEDLFTRAATAVLTGMKTAGVNRLVWLSSFGVGDTYESASPAQKVMYRTFLRDIYANKELSEQLIRTSDVEWTLVYPTTLTNGPAQGTYRVGDRLPMKGAPTISRADVGAFLHEACRTEWVRRDAVLTD